MRLPWIVTILFRNGFKERGWRFRHPPHTPDGYYKQAEYFLMLLGGMDQGFSEDDILTVHRELSFMIQQELHHFHITAANRDPKPRGVFGAIQSPRDTVIKRIYLLFRIAAIIADAISYQNLHDRLIAEPAREDQWFRGRGPEVIIRLAF